MDCPRCSAPWRTMKSRIPRCVFFPPNQSRFLSRSASDIAVIAFLACAKDSFKVATTLALSVADFSKPFTSNPAGGGVPNQFVEVEVGGADVHEDFRKGANIGRGAPCVLVRRDRLGEANKFVFLHDDFGKHLGEPVTPGYLP